MLLTRCCASWSGGCRLHCVTLAVVSVGATVTVGTTVTVGAFVTAVAFIAAVLVAVVTVITILFCFMLISPIYWHVLYCLFCCLSCYII